MQYILTEDEYKDLIEKARKEIEANKAVIQDLCTKVADNMPVKYWGNNYETPWTCVFTNGTDHYCDECPVIDACPNKYKHFSK